MNRPATFQDRVSLDVDLIPNAGAQAHQNSQTDMGTTKRKPVRSEQREALPLRTGKRAPTSSTGTTAELITIIEKRESAWSASDLAKLLGCSDKHIYSLAKSGRMPHLRIGGVIRFDPGATAAWLRERYIAA